MNTDAAGDVDDTCERMANGLTVRSDLGGGDTCGSDVNGLILRTDFGVAVAMLAAGNVLTSETGSVRTNLGEGDTCGSDVNGLISRTDLEVAVDMLAADIVLTTETGSFTKCIQWLSPSSSDISPNRSSKM